MILTLILAGFFGMIAPWLGFMVLFIGGAFVVGTGLGLLSIVAVILLIWYLMAVVG